MYNNLSRRGSLCNRPAAALGHGCGASGNVRGAGGESSRGPSGRWPDCVQLQSDIQGRWAHVRVVDAGAVCVRVSVCVCVCVCVCV